MPIAPKPKLKTPSEAEIHSIIEKGGSPAKQTEQSRTLAPRKEQQTVIVQVPTALLEEIDALRASRMASPSRSQWIREALLEKLEKERRG